MILCAALSAQEIEMKYLDIKEANPKDLMGVTPEGNFAFSYKPLLEYKKSGYFAGLANHHYYLNTANNHYAIYQLHDAKAGAYNRHYFKLNDKYQPDGPGKLYWSQPTETKKAGAIMSSKNIPYIQGNTDLGNLRAVLSPDKKLILNVNVEGDMDYFKLKDKLYIRVYDENFQLLWEKEQVFDRLDMDLAFYTAFITNSGKVVLLAAERVGDYVYKEWASETYEFVHKAFVITANDIKEDKLGLSGTDDDLFDEIELRAIDDDNLLIAGTYATEKGNKGNESGIFNAFVNLNTGKVQIKNKAFASATIDFFNTSKKKELLHFMLNNIEQAPDGGWYFFLTQDKSLSLTSTTVGQGINYTKSATTSQGFLVVGVDKDFNVKFESPVANTFNTYTSYTGCGSFLTDKHILLLYNYAKAGTYPGTELRYTLMGFDGKVEKQGNLSLYKKGMYYSFNDVQLAKNKIVFTLSAYDGDGYGPIMGQATLTLKE